MLNFLSSRLQRSIKKIKSKTTISEKDVIEIIREIKLSLLEADVNLKVVKDFTSEIKRKALGSEIIGKLNASQQIVKLVNDELIKILGSKPTEIKVNKNPYIIMLVGLQGTGKTTTAAKLAYYFSKKHKLEKPLLVAADIYRPAAVEQLKTLGKQLKIETFYDQTKTLKPNQIVKQSLDHAHQNSNDLVIIDTAGRLSIDEELMREVVELKKTANPSQTLFVIDALAGQDVINVAEEFHRNLKLTGAIITKLDSNARGGSALSVAHILKIPISYIGVGERTRDFELFYPERMAKRILGMGDVLSLIEKASEVIDENESKHMLNRMVHGHFDLNDLLSQLQQMQKMGKMSKLLEMIPGASNKVSESQIQKAEKRLRFFKILISSMTDEERRKPKLLKNSDRKVRIIKGSGRSNQEYNLLVSEFEKMAKQMKSVSKAIKDGNFNPSMMPKV